MKIVEVDEKEKTIKVRVDNEDDLWEVYNVLYKNDTVIGKTTREVKTATASWRRPVTLTIQVEWAEMQPMTNRLRIHGTVIESPEDLEIKGKHHTINLEPGSIIMIIKKESWNDLDLKRLKEAEKRTYINALIASIDSEDFAVARLTNSGLQIIYEEKLDLRLKNKDSPQESEKRELVKVAKSLKRLFDDLKPNIVAVSGPSIYLEKLLNVLKDYIKDTKIVTVDTSYGGSAGLREALKKDALKEALRASETLQEQELMERFMYMIGKDMPVAYGLEPVEEAALRGAVDTLLIDKEIMNEPETRSKIINIVEMVIASKGKVKVFTTNQEARFWLKNMGGIAAMLRYKIF
ncbi:MAG: hypothetical protein ACP5LX_01780 [Nitrososphaeria archaeon]